MNIPISLDEVTSHKWLYRKWSIKPPGAYLTKSRLGAY